MALVVSQSCASPSNRSPSTTSTEALLEKELLVLGSTHNCEEDSNPKKRPRVDASSIAGPCTGTSSTSSASYSNTSTNSIKRPRREKRRVQFHAELTRTRTFSTDYDPEELWWTNEESKLHMERQSNLLQFYANNCAEMAESVLLVWVHCAEEAMADGNYCMTMEQRAEVALSVAQSPVRGFEKELAAELISEQRLKTIGGILELQALCQQNGVDLQEKQEALAAASEAFSLTANLFATSVAQGDATVAKQYCQMAL